MPRLGRPSASIANTSAHIAVLATRWNAAVVDKLLAGALETLERAGATHELFRVPGSFELPQIARRVARTGRSSVDLRVGIFSGDACLAVAENIMVVIARDSGRPMPLPAMLLEKLECYAFR